MNIAVLVSAYTQPSIHPTSTTTPQPPDPSGDTIAALTGLDDYDKTPAHYFPNSTPPTTTTTTTATATTSPSTTTPPSPYTFTTIPLYKSTSYRVLRSLVHAKRYACYFVLCDGAKDEDRAGEEVLRALEEFNVPYTGVALPHFDPSKAEMKMFAHYANIRCPPWVVLKEVPASVGAMGAVVRAHGLAYPLIVKHPHGFNSVGMTRGSKCGDDRACWEQVGKTVGSFQGALVEEFVTGDEVTVLAVQTPGGTRVLPPVQMRFPEGEDFKHFDLKWKTFGEMEWVPVPVEDPAYGEMVRVGKVAFESMLQGVGLGRCDLRVDRRTNEVYFLEINPNPGIFYAPGDEGSADMILKYNAAEFGHQEVTKALIESAFLEQEKRAKRYVVSFDPRKGYHLRAARDLRAGDLVFEDEGKPMPMVTRPYVMKHWDEDSKADFERYAWPLSDDGHIYAVWDEDHTKWRPINHSCSPSTIFAAPHSLNMIASRDIKKGEELTMDYAAFCDETMKPFECNCGAPECRKSIFADPAVIARYGPNAWHRRRKQA